MKILITLVVLFNAAVAQTVYQIPFASTGNSIELEVANTSNIPLFNVEVRVTNAPSWIKFRDNQQKVALLKANEESSALFPFSVDKLAPVKHEQTLSFSITSKTGESWTKEIKVSITPPEHFELFQNYPNPFNPATTISYQLSANSKVSLKVFNLLGQEVATLVNEEKLAGYYQEQFDARTLASGVYVYQLSISDERGNRHVARKTMVVLK
ncbi:MAG: T9SS type A sorting domain-containing protein [Ignavibacteriales bacterium]|nr:T9SS type A sorting domain-containing protein [Ignavibacteriales bacterium]